MHHAYYIEGPLSQFGQYKEHLKPLWAREFERFGVGDARELKELAGFKNFDEAVYLIAAHSITSEAQQALLKLFEEPQQGTVFVVLLPHGSLLPTLRSRMMPYPNEQGETLLKGARFRLATNLEAKKFLKLSHKERSAYIAKLLKEEEGVKEQVRELLNGLELELHVRLRKSTSKEVREGLEDIAKVRSYVGDRAPSLKMLLEHLALVLPKL